jgi:hypothetical protein
MSSAAIVFGLALLTVPGIAIAQDEDIEPRTIGATGTTSLGFSGFVDTFSSSEDRFPLLLTVHADLRRFLTNRIAAHGGLIGSGSFRDDSDERSGPGASALHLQLGTDYYFTPASIASLYAGAEYRAQLTRRAEKDAGTLLGVGGVQAAISSRASVFVQGGYGLRLTRGSEGETQTRLTGEIGLRFKF